jgi:uncharacterized protein (TIGR03083 family)
MFEIERVRQSWQRESDAIDAIVLTINDATATQPIRNDGWTTQDLLGHIAHTARSFLAYVTERDDVPRAPFDVDAYNAAQRAKNQARPWLDVLNYWQRTRDEIVVQLAGFDNALGAQPVGLPWLPDVQTKGEALRIMILHTRQHRQELEQGFPEVQA